MGPSPDLNKVGTELRRIVGERPVDPTLRLVA
jgi:hypothetical protein